MNPYIITAKLENVGDGIRLPADAIQSRRAFATLDYDARAHIRDLVVKAGVKHGTTSDPVTDQGGTIGPLPDGSVIEVERVELSQLAETLVPSSDDRAVDLVELWSYGEIIDAYNAAQKG